MPDPLAPQFNWRGPGELKALAESLSLSIHTNEDASVLAEPVRVGPLTAPNSLAVHPMEGCDGDADGRPGELTARRYRRFIAGGAGLIWVEAVAVLPEARANPRQLWLNEKSRGGFARLFGDLCGCAAESHGSGHRPILVAQLTHSGRHSRPRPIIVQHDSMRDAYVNVPSDYPVATDEYLDSLQDAFVAAARLAFEVGFDAVDIKACHGYLIGELLAAHTREGRYGGSFENRTRFLLDVIDRIHSELGEDKMVVTRLGVFDAVAYPHGWGVDRDDPTQPDLAEPKLLMERLAERHVPMVNVTLASPYYNPHYGRPYERPAEGGYESPEHPLAGVCRAIDLAGEMQAAFPKIAVIGTGYSWLRTLLPYVGAGSKSTGRATFIGAGRLAIAYPDFAADIIRTGRLDPQRVCVCCSGCTQIMRDGGMTGCVVRDSEIYGPILRRGRSQRQGRKPE